METDSLEKRISSLERQCFLLRCALSAIAVGLALSVACVGPSRNAATIEARAFVLKDAEGKVRGEWAPSGEQDGKGGTASITCMRFLDREGQLAFHSCGRWDEDASSSVLVSDRSGARIALSADSEGASLRVGDQRPADGSRVAHVGLTASGDSAQLIVGPGGPHAAILTVDEFLMRDARGHVFVRLPEKTRREE